MKYSRIKEIHIVGVGGGGAYSIAKFFMALGVNVYGFDIATNPQIKELIDDGMIFTERNPNTAFTPHSAIYIYSDALPAKVKDNLRELNRGSTGIEVGEFFDTLIKHYESGSLNKKEILAFKSSNIAPLYFTDMSNLKLIGVTGTDGKTTVSTMIYHMLLSLGKKPALISTVGALIAGEAIETGFHVTTPSANDIEKIIEMVIKKNCSHLIIESTSHGLKMGRLAGLKFDVVAITNITEEHLDYHKTWNNLFEAKSRIITRHLKDNGVAVINRDDERSYKKLKQLRANFIEYSSNITSDITAAEIKDSSDGYKFSINNLPTQLKILGRYNISNALAAIGTILSLNEDWEKAVDSLPSFKPIAGRMNILQSKPYRIIVDFAHTPNSLLNAVESVKTSGRLILVFGCAGQRDQTKRSKMGKVAGDHADITILTAEDPRFEKLSNINDQIEDGWKSSKRVGEIVRFDDDSNNVKVRADAIKHALAIARKGDTILITGKGHENSMCFGATEYDWNDTKFIEEILNVK